MNPCDTVVEGGTLVTADETMAADLGIRDGVIAAIGHDLPGRVRLNAHGKLVIPGGVDPHVHLEMTTPATTSSDTWETGTRAAAFGGTTTVVDFIEPQLGERLAHALEMRCAQAAGHAVIDFGFHMTLCRTDAETLAELPAMSASGISTYKAYTTYPGLKLNDAQLVEVMRAVKRAGGLLLVHAEDDARIEWATRACLEEGHRAPRDFARSRPAEAETEAIARVLALSDAVAAPIYFVHVSTATGAEAIASAHSRGRPIYGETCPQYLLLTAAEYDRPGFEGAKYVCSPPLRTPEDCSGLWQALAHGDLQTVGTDHCPFNFHGQKDLGRETFTAIPGGVPGIESRVALLYTFGVGSGRLTLHQWVDLCCTSPARLLGLGVRKGTLEPGTDADIVIFDPDCEVTLSHDMLHEKVDYTPYEGLRLKGYPTTTLSRGEVIVENGRFVGAPGRGRYVKRHRPALPGDARP